MCMWEYSDGIGGGDDYTMDFLRDSLVCVWIFMGHEMVFEDCR